MREKTVTRIEAFDDGFIAGVKACITAIRKQWKVYDGFTDKDIGVPMGIAVAACQRLIEEEKDA